MQNPKQNNSPQQQLQQQVGSAGQLGQARVLPARLFKKEQQIIIKNLNATWFQLLSLGLPGSLLKKEIFQRQGSNLTNDKSEANKESQHARQVETGLQKRWCSISAPFSKLLSML